MQDLIDSLERMLQDKLDDLRKWTDGPQIHLRKYTEHGNEDVTVEIVGTVREDIKTLERVIEGLRGLM